MSAKSRLFMLEDAPKSMRTRTGFVPENPPKILFGYEARTGRGLDGGRLGASRVMKCDALGLADCVPHVVSP